MVSGNNESSKLEKMLKKEIVKRMNAEFDPPGHKKTSTNPKTTPKTKPPTKSTTTKPYIDHEKFDMRIAAIKMSLKDCEGGKCITHIREAMNDLQKVGNKLDRDYTTGKLDAAEWKKNKSQVRKVQKEVDTVMGDAVSHFEKCMSSGKKSH
jgi:hypothetical protein